MTKGEAIETILVNVLGGVLTDNADVLRADIPTYLAACIDYVVKTDLDDRRNRQLRNKVLFRNLMSRIDEDLLCTYKLTPKEDTDRNEYYVVLPVAIQSTFGNAGLNYSGPVNIYGQPFSKVGNRSMLAGILDITDMVFYYYEKSGEAQEQRVYYVNLGYPVCDVFVRILVGVSDLDNDAELPIPLGYEKIVIDMAVEFFREQRMTPSGDQNWNTDKELDRE